MRIAVASGKGGTGKTAVATSLAWLLARRGERVTYVDADVEEPNGHLFLAPRIERRRRHGVRVPALRDGPDGATCSGCGQCQQVCAYHAIVALADRVLVLPELCHGCGACAMACPEQALVERERGIGDIEHGVAGDDGSPMGFLAGTLDVGEARATPLIGGVLGALNGCAGHVIVDAPPGTSCPALEAIRDADVVLLVTEPTAFGLHDLKLAVAMARALGRPTAAVLNRADLGDGSVRGFLRDRGIPRVAEIPFLRDAAEAYAAGRVPAEASPGFREPLEYVVGRLLRGELG